MQASTPLPPHSLISPNSDQVLLQRMIDELLAFDELREAEAIYAFAFGNGWRKGDPSSTI